MSIVNGVEVERRQSVVFKYVLSMGPETVIALPYPFKVLKVGRQNGDLMIWVQHHIPAEVKELVNVRFRVVGTGERFQAGNLKHVGTAQEEANPFVWHVYQVVD